MALYPPAIEALCGVYAVLKPICGFMGCRGKVVAYVYFTNSMSRYCKDHLALTKKRAKGGRESDQIVRVESATAYARRVGV